MQPDDFDALFTQHAQPLLAFLTYRLGDRAAAEDVLADTFERALRSRRRFDARRGDAKSWLYAIAVNLVRDSTRRAGAERRALAAEIERHPDGGVSPDASTQVETHRLVTEALTVLSPQERELIALRYGADLTVPEIAALLKLPLTTVEGRLYRALNKLRAELDGS